MCVVFFLLHLSLSRFFTSQYFLLFLPKLYPSLSYYIGIYFVERLVYVAIPNFKFTALVTAPWWTTKYGYETIYGQWLRLAGEKELGARPPEEQYCAWFLAYGSDGAWLELLMNWRSHLHTQMQVLFFSALNSWMERNILLKLCTSFCVEFLNARTQIHKITSARLMGRRSARKVHRHWTTTTTRTTTNEKRKKKAILCMHVYVFHM